MSDSKALQTMNQDALESVLLGGDLERLKPQERVNYMLKVCETLGLNPLTKPFEFIKLNGKLVMYARRECTEQLRKLNGISVRITGREIQEGVYIVTASAKDKHGREDESTGCVPVDRISGEARANAYMKAETKAKRRVTLSISGLGMLDESEVESLPRPANDPTPYVQRPAPAYSGESTEAIIERFKAKTGALDVTPLPKGLVAVAEAVQPSAEPATDLVGCWRKVTEGSKKAHTFKEEWLALDKQPRRNEVQNRKIQALRKERGISEEDWRARLLAKFNKTSSADLSVEEASRLIEALEEAIAKWGTAEQKAAKQHNRALQAQAELAEYVGEALPEELVPVSDHESNS